MNLAAYPFYLAAIVWPGANLAGAGHNVLRVLPGDRAWDRDEHPQSRLVQPGLATALALHLPIGIYYIVFVNTAHLVRGSDYLYGALGFIASDPQAASTPTSAKAPAAVVVRFDP